jgi:hypothetical protein
MCQLLYLTAIVKKCKQIQSSNPESIIISHGTPDTGGGTRSWMRHCTTSRKVAGSITDEVIEFFTLPNPSSRTMALGST